MKGEGRNSIAWLYLVSVRAPGGEKPQGKEYVVAKSRQPTSYSWGPPDSKEDTNEVVASGGCLSTPQQLWRDMPQPKAPG